MKSAMLTIAVAMLAVAALAVDEETPLAKTNVETRVIATIGIVIDHHGVQYSTEGLRVMVYALGPDGKAVPLPDGNGGSIPQRMIEITWPEWRAAMLGLGYTGPQVTAIQRDAFKKALLAVVKAKLQ